METNDKMTLKQRMECFRNLYDYNLPKRSYTMVMVDGRSFSKNIKNKFEKPFDDWFINAMNLTAEYICRNVQGVKLAYVQSDEISIVLTDFDNEETQPFYGNRLCKLHSIIASLATCKFNQLLAIKTIHDNMYSTTLEDNEKTIFTPWDCIDTINGMNLLQFDCKAWNLPTYNDVYAWFHYRQIDCIKNSKQQTAQTYLPHKMLHGLDTDKQIELLKETKNINWDSFPNDRKYGRFITRKLFNEKITNPKTNEEIMVTKKRWVILDGFDIKDKDRFNGEFQIPVLDIQ